MSYLSPGCIIKDLTRTGVIDEESVPITVILCLSIDKSTGHKVNPGENILNRYLDPLFTKKLANGISLALIVVPLFASA